MIHTVRDAESKIWTLQKEVTFFKTRINDLSNQIIKLQNDLDAIKPSINNSGNIDSVVSSDGSSITHRLLHIFDKIKVKIQEFIDLNVTNKITTKDLEATGNTTLNTLTVGNTTVNNLVSRYMAEIAGGPSLPAHPVLNYTSDGITRWSLGMNYSTTNYSILRYSSFGNYIDTPLDVAGANGRLTIGGSGGGGILMQTRAIGDGEILSGHMVMYASEADSKLWFRCRFSNGLIKVQALDLV